jgi:hypothetical protein
MKTRMFVAVIISTLLAAGLPGNTRSQTAQRCFPETGQCIEGRFREYWEQNGGLPVFGYPTRPQREEIVEGHPFQAQWFERERFEAHPENSAPYDVLLGRLGDELLKRRGRDWHTFPQGQPQEGCQFFEMTGHTVCEPFLSYWRGHGLEFDGQPGTSYEESLALFGLPLSEPAVETNSSGDTVLTQWFERARFELHPQNAPPYNVLLGLLGNEILSLPSKPTIITISPDDLDKLADVLGEYGLSKESVNTTKTVASALPAIVLQSQDADGVLMLSAPLNKAPIETIDPLFNSDKGVPVGVLQTERVLPVGDPAGLPRDIYLVLVRKGKLLFINGDNKEFSGPSVGPDQLRRMRRVVDPPETTISLKDVCYSWRSKEGSIQVCADEPAPQSALTSTEAQTITNTMQDSVNALQNAGLLNADDINVAGVLPDVASQAAVDRRQANLLVAPTRKFSFDPGAEPVDGALLGVVDVLLDAELHGVQVPKGAYVVRATRSENEWQGRFVREDGLRIDVPARVVEVRGQIEEPLVILLGFWLIFCFEC